jgi:hypothetical protein
MHARAVVTSLSTIPILDRSSFVPFAFGKTIRLSLPIPTTKAEPIVSRYDSRNGILPTSVRAI